MKRNNSPPHLFRQTIWALGLREWTASLRSPAMYIATTVAAILQVQILSAPLSFLSNNRLLVMRDPLIPAFLGSIAVVAIYIVISATTSLVREREQQTLRELFYTPINHTTLIVAKFVGQFLTALACVLIAFALILLGSWVTQFAISVQLTWAIFLCLLLLANMIAFGLTLSVYALSARAAILLLLATLFFLSGVQIVNRAIVQIFPLVESSMLVYMLPVLTVINAIAAILSPLAYLMRGLEAVSLSSTSGILFGILTSVAYTTIFLLVAVQISRWRGVTR